MSIDRKTVEYVSHLARIELDEQELSVLAGQLTGILDFIDTLTEADISGVAATSHVLNLRNVLREDLPGTSLENAEALRNAPRREGEFFGVPKVIE